MTPRSALRPLGEVAGGLFDALLPQTCVGCGAWISAGRGLSCASCRAALQNALEQPACPRCGRTLPAAAIHDDACARCRTEPFWNLAGVARVGTYGGVDRDMLLGLKYCGHERNAECLAEWLEAAIRRQAWPDRLDALVPVPMHWLRRQQRPCDHARVLAAALARRLDIPVHRLVRRARHSPSQTNMPSRTKRFENVKGCFAPPYWWLPQGRWWAAALERMRPGVRGQTVCIVDNLIVSGATVTEVAKVLRRAGARRIYAAVVSRAPSPGDPAAGIPADEAAVVP